MAWKYRPPTGFPARYPVSLRTAVASLGTPVLLHSGSSNEVRADAENFRFYRWCLRQRPDADSVLASYLEVYSIRTSMEPAPAPSAYWFLYLTAQRSKLSDLFDLNPHLRETIIAECQ